MRRAHVDGVACKEPNAMSYDMELCDTDGRISSLQPESSASATPKTTPVG